MRAALCLFCLLLAAAGRAHAGVPAQASVQAPVPSASALPGEAAPGVTDGDAESANLEAIVVTGEQPGPGMWRVTKDGHVLSVLGMLSPLPRRMQWRDDAVAREVAASAAVLLTPQVKFEPKIGFFGKLALLPSLAGLRDNPDHQRLVDVLDADTYARWTALRRRYLPRGDAIERRRPLFAAVELYEAAIKAAGLSTDPVVTDAVRKAARRADVPLVPVETVFEIDEPRAALKAFKRSPIDDQDCLRRTLDRIDEDLGRMAERANAWATGDLAALQAMPYTDQLTACRDAIVSAPIARVHHLADLESRTRSAWLDAAMALLAKNERSFAVLPMRLIAGERSLLDALRARGCTIQAPDEADVSVDGGEGAVDAGTTHL